MEQKLVNFLQKCQNIRQLKQTHLQIISNGYKDNNFIVPKLINLSSDFISLDYAINIFQCMRNPSFIVYNNLIKCCIGKARKDAIIVYNQMRSSFIMPNSFTFTFLLRSLESFNAFVDGETVHGQIVKLGFESSVFIQNTLLDFYAKCGGNLARVQQVFDEMPRDVVSWNTMIGAYMKYGQFDSAIELFEVMPERNIVTWNSVINGLSKAGNMKLAYTVFQRMPEKNTVSYNTMISGYIKFGDMKTAQTIFDKMPEKSVVSWTTMITGYASINDIKSAKRNFDKMPIKNVVSWNAMIACYVNAHMFNQALSIFHNMLIDGHCKPDQTTLISVLSACTHLNSHEHGIWIHSYIKKNKFDLSLPLGNALIDMFSKCGDVENAILIFKKMSTKCVITWTSMISGLAVNGNCKEALQLFDEMPLGIKRDDVLFIAVLSACVHGGLLDEGKRVFSQMVNDFKIIPRIEHYGCMVDLLGRAGKFDEAMKFIKTMDLKPNVVIWATLLSACKIYGNGAMFECLTKEILDLEPLNSSYLTLITNLSSSVGRWEDALNFRVTSRDQGVEKIPGCSSIQVGDLVHEFLAKDTRHVQRKEVYGLLGCLNEHMRYVY